MYMYMYMYLFISERARTRARAYRVVRARISPEGRMKESVSHLIPAIRSNQLPCAIVSRARPLRSVRGSQPPGASCDFNAGLDNTRARARGRDRGGGRNAGTRVNFVSTVACAIRDLLDLRIDLSFVDRTSSSARSSSNSAPARCLFRFWIISGKKNVGRKNVERARTRCTRRDI